MHYVLIVLYSIFRFPENGQMRVEEIRILKVAVSLILYSRWRSYFLFFFFFYFLAKKSGYTDIEYI